MKFFWRLAGIVVLGPFYLLYLVLKGVSKVKGGGRGSFGCGGSSGDY